MVSVKRNSGNPLLGFYSIGILYITIKLSPWNRVCLEKVISIEVFKKASLLFWNQKVYNCSQEPKTGPYSKNPFLFKVLHNIL
jgi:hypothetical protein